MADLEDHAIKRDKRFLVRLIVVLLVGLVVGIYIYGKLTSESLGSCAAGAFGDVTDAPAEQPR